ncbi:MAG: hydrogenase maturation nickel metallochaperone HypA [Proteobacteria bacterium]|nr:hydrogenase maturation nickel metallochaperone HypA [Pseudomonadota bacterium]
MIARVAREQGAARVNSATVAIGELSTVAPAALEFAFEALRAGTVAADCRIVVQSVPLVLCCPRCELERPGRRERPGCPRCGAESAAVVAGRELRLLAIDVED